MGTHVQKNAGTDALELNEPPQAVAFHASSDKPGQSPLNDSDLLTAMTTSKLRWKLMVAGVCAACAFGGIAMRIAWATPPQGFTATNIVGPVVLEEINTKSEADDHIEIKSKGLTDV